MVNIKKMTQRARVASRSLAILPEAAKNHALTVLANSLFVRQDEILQANQADIETSAKFGLDDAMIDRLRLTSDRIKGIAEDVRTVVELPDPIGKIFDQKVMPNGLHVHKQRVPVGVLAVIYESRPNVTVDVAALALKSGNVVILRGGKETINSNKVLVNIIQTTYEQCGLNSDFVQFIDSPERSLVQELLTMYDTVDMLIPRGGSKLHQYCRENSMIPVITGGIGICHLFVDQTADLNAAVKVIHNAKTQRPTVCNALDTVLVHESIAKRFIPQLIERLAAANVSIRLHENAASYCHDLFGDCVQPAREGDFDREWLSLVLGVKVVRNLEEAIEHIQEHSTGHSDGILTDTEENSDEFVRRVDSAVVYVNASTRFTDGSQLGLGAEVAISTQRLHARGPMALEELTTYKWVVRGENHIRE